MSVRLFVGGLSFSTSTERLREAFARYGGVDSAAVMTDRETGRSRGFGFVEMSTTEAAEQAIGALNGSNLDGRTIRVDRATPRGTAPPRTGPPDRRPMGGGPGGAPPTRRPPPLGGPGLRGPGDRLGGFPPRPGPPGGGRGPGDAWNLGAGDQRRGAGRRRDGEGRRTTGEGRRGTRKSAGPQRRSGDRGRRSPGERFPPLRSAPRATGHGRTRHSLLGNPRFHPHAGPPHPPIRRQPELGRSARRRRPRDHSRLRHGG